jgi:hypothetical protein
LHEKKEKESEVLDIKVDDLTNLIAKMMGLAEDKNTIKKEEN